MISYIDGIQARATYARLDSHIAWNGFDHCIEGSLSVLDWSRRQVTDFLN